MADPIITLTTDFGTSDHLVGTMKGVILNINPAVRIVDINHSVVPFDLLDGALSIANAYSFSRRARCMLSSWTRELAQTAVRFW